MMPDLATLPAYSLLQWAVVGVFPALMIAAAASDAASMRIPNWLTGTLAMAFPIAAAGTAMPLETLGLHVAVGFGALIICMGLFATGWIGGGDAKFFAATALWLGPYHILGFALISTVLGGFLTLALLSFRKLPMPAPLAAQGWLMRLHDPKEGVPYGLALAAGGLLVFGQSAWIAGAA
ncbi:prepilin peptidase [Pyruvatibacter sp.]|uniref:A24 family peptidase n=1 Tax=unclassified Pyruvatibacter TaxID=2618840 RepID=UPI00296A1CB6|nr:prepilin peptidase [Alphaproteobacteria bacterium]